MSDWPSKMNGMDLDRFMSFVSPEPTSGCWLWTGAMRNGYGAWHHTSGAQPARAHRAAWTLMRGPIPDGLVVCHRCDNPACVNPAHLFLGTIADNNADMVSKGRHQREERGSRTRLSRAQAADAIRRYAAGDTQKDIALSLGVTQAAISLIVTGAGWTSLDRAALRSMPSRRRGERNTRAKITESDVREIRALRASGVTLRPLAARYGLSRSAVQFLLSGRTWGHVT